MTSKGQSKSKRGKGLVNRLINNLPVELHLPGYQYCGPGTKLQKRLARGDPGINPLDAACKEHDIAYSKNRENLKVRHAADKILTDTAWKRVFSPDASIAEKAAAWSVTNIMKAKRKFGMGAKKRGGIRRGTRRCGGSVSIKKIIGAAKKTMSQGGNSRDTIKSALKGARMALKNSGGKRKLRALPRILPVPAKVGGFLPLLVPIFAGLSAVGALSGGAASIAKAVNAAQAAERELAESKRHNKTMESIALGKGLHLKPYKTGFGLQIMPKNVK